MTKLFPFMRSHIFAGILVFISFLLLFIVLLFPYLFTESAFITNSYFSSKVNSNSNTDTATNIDSFRYMYKDYIRTWNIGLLHYCENTQINPSVNLGDRSSTDAHTQNEDEHIGNHCGFINWDFTINQDSFSRYVYLIDQTGKIISSDADIANQDDTNAIRFENSEDFAVRNDDENNEDDTKNIDGSPMDPNPIPVSMPRDNSSTTTNQNSSIEDPVSGGNSNPSNENLFPEVTPTPSNEDTLSDGGIMHPQPPNIPLPDFPGHPNDPSSIPVSENFGTSTGSNNINNDEVPTTRSTTNSNLVYDSKGISTFFTVTNVHMFNALRVITILAIILNAVIVFLFLALAILQWLTHQHKKQQILKKVLKVLRILLGILLIFWAIILIIYIAIYHDNVDYLLHQIKASNIFAIGYFMTILWIGFVLVLSAFIIVKFQIKYLTYTKESKIQHQEHAHPHHTVAATGSLDGRYNYAMTEPHTTIQFSPSAFY